MGVLRPSNGSSVERLRSSGPLVELGRHKKALAIILSLTLGLFLYSQSLQYNYSSRYSSSSGASEYDPTYLVKTEGCQLRAMDAFDPITDKFIKTRNVPSCATRPVVTLVNGSHLVIDETLVKGERSRTRGHESTWKYRGAKCCWREIKRKNQEPDNYDKDNADFSVIENPYCNPIPLGKEGGVVSRGVQYLKVECSSPNGVEVWKDFYALAPSPKVLSPATGNKTEFWAEERRKNPNATLPPSIMVIGIDSISRLHMIRSLPRTKEFLTSKGFVEMRGYNKIGDNTFPNILAAFAGMMEKEAIASCWPTRKTKLDDCPYIWKNFSALNYVTSLVEDAPGIAIFNYDKTGFVLPPVDYYLRPLMVAEHKASKRYRWSGGNACLGGGLTPTRFLFRYIQHFVKEVDGLAPFFLLSWFTSVAHDDFNGLKPYDPEFRSFLDNLLSSVGENTVILFISDHGYRFGPFRETFLGFYEESLPFFFLRLPPTLANENPDWGQALRVNSDRLTTPHDLYATFVQLLGVVSPKPKSAISLRPAPIPRPLTSLHGPSLFQIGPLERNCEDSSIPQKYCMCGVTEILTTSTTLASDLGNFVVSGINAELAASNLSESTCAKISYSKFIYGREVGEGEAWNGHGKLEPYRDVLLAVETEPWDNRFEARVRIFEDRKEILGTVGRINSYAGKSDCISHYKMKLYCTCITLWENELNRRSEKKKKKMMKHHRRATNKG